MKMRKKTATATIWVCIIVMAAVAFYLDQIKVIDLGNTWTRILLFIGALVIPCCVMFIQSRIDPEAYKAWRAEMLKEAEEEEQAENEIKGLQIKRTMGETICEFITLMMLIVSWILILQTHQSAEEIKVAALCSVGAIWFLVTAYFHRVMGFPAMTARQLQLGIYRKRALALICAIFLICGCLFPGEAKVTEWFCAIAGGLFVLLFASKFVINTIKK